MKTKNAKIELLEEVKGKCVVYVEITYNPHFSQDDVKWHGTLEEVIPKLDFDYYPGYGSQHIEGTIWYEDGSWSERAEYDGSEWWEHKSIPELPKGANALLAIKEKCKPYVTKREYFAAMAMQGLCAHSGDYHRAESLAQDSLMYADALLAELERTK